MTEDHHSRLALFSVSTTILSDTERKDRPLFIFTLIIENKIFKKWQPKYYRKYFKSSSQRINIQIAEKF